MPSSRTWPAAVVTPSRSTGPTVVTFTSASGAPVASFTVMVNTAVAVDGAAGRGARPRRRWGGRRLRRSGLRRRSLRQRGTWHCEHEHQSKRGSHLAILLTPAAA